MARPIFGPSTGSINTVIKFAKSLNIKDILGVTEFLNELWRVASLGGMDPFSIAVQSALETDNWREPNWTAFRNPAGIGITVHLMPSPYVFTPTTAARAVVLHHCAYTGKLPKELKQYVSSDPRYKNVFDAKFNGTVKEWSDYGQGKWAADPNYFTNLEIRRSAINKFASKDEVTTVADNELSYVMHVTLVPKGQTNNRPGIPQVVKWINVHETANRSYGADAAMHSRWLLNGAPGAAGAQVCVHYFVDDVEGFKMLPDNEVSWNAGCGNCEGNYGGISIEICVNADGNYEKALRHTAELVASKLHEHKLPLSKVVTHNYWSGKWCPAIMLTQKRWPAFLEMVKSYYYATSPALPASADAQPVMVNGVPWDGKKDVTVNGNVFHGEIRRVTVSAPSVEVKQWASLDSARTRNPLKQGSTFSVLGWVKGEKINKEDRWWVTKAGSRIHMGGTAEKAGDNTTHPGENPYDKVVNGVRFYAVTKDGKTIRVKAAADETPVLRYSTVNSEEKRKPLSKGETFTAKYWVRGEVLKGDERYWVTLHDSRVPVSGTVEKPAP